MAEAASMPIDARRAPLPLLTGPRLGVGVSPVPLQTPGVPSPAASRDDVGLPRTRFPRLLEVCHVAHRFSCSQEFVRRLIRDGKLGAFRIGHRWRVDELALEAYLARCRQEALKKLTLTTTAQRPRMQPFSPRANA